MVNFSLTYNLERISEMIFKNQSILINPLTQILTILFCRSQIMILHIIKLHDN